MANRNMNAQKVSEAPDPRPSDYLFDVFISYSRKDEEFGKRLEKALEDYRLPRDVKTTLLSKNRLRVFRDRKDLVPTDGDYYQTIGSYLNRSAYLIVICSPNARQSEYVNQEISAFLKSHEAKRIIPVLLAGKPNNEVGVATEEYAFPDALCAALKMPLALGFTEFQQYSGKINKGRYHDSWYTLLAKIFGAERAEIERLDAKRQSRRRVILAAVSFAIISVLSVALIFAVISRQEAVTQRQEAINQRDSARRLLYASDMNLAQRAFESNNFGLGMKTLEYYLAGNQSGQEDLRGFEWYYLWRRYNGQLASFNETHDLAFSRDGASFVTVGAGALKTWDADSMRETATVKLNGNSTSASDESVSYYQTLDFSPDGRTVAYNFNEKVMLLDIGSGSTREVPVPQTSKTQAEDQDREEFVKLYWSRANWGTPRFSPDGKLLAVSYGCGVVALFDAKSLQLIATPGEGPGASDCTSLVTFSPDSKILAYGNLYSVNLWDTTTNRELGGPTMDNSLPDSVNQIESAAFSSDGKLLAIGDRSKQIVLWNMLSKKVLARLKGHEEWVSALAFSPDGKILYSGSRDHTVKLWDFTSYSDSGSVNSDKIKVIATINGHTGSINSIKCSRNGRIATVSTDGTVKLWDRVANDSESFPDVEVVSPSATAIAKYSDDGVATSTTLFDIRSDNPVPLWTFSKIVHVTVSPDYKYLATTNYDAIERKPSTLKLLDLNSQQELITLQTHHSAYRRVFSRDGKLLTALSADGKTVILVDTAQRKELAPLRSDSELKEYLLSADGKMVVTADNVGRRLKSWDVATQKQLAIFETKEKVAQTPYDEEPPVSLSPDGKLLAISNSAEVELWDTSSTQKSIRLGKHEATVSVMSFSPDGKLLAVGDDNGGVKVWDVLTQKDLATFKGHRESASALAFSPDSKTLASGGSDGVVKLYAMASMRELITLTHEPSATSETHAFQGGEDYVDQLFFGADGRSLVTHSGNGVLRIWRGLNDENVVSSAGQKTSL